MFIVSGDSNNRLLQLLFADILAQNHITVIPMLC